MYNAPLGFFFSYLPFCWRNLSRYKNIDPVDPNRWDVEIFSFFLIIDLCPKNT